MCCSVPSSRKGDHILAARFLSRFVPAAIPWLHLDLAAGSRHGGLAHIATEITGFGVRYTLDLLRRGWPPPARVAMNRLTIQRPDDWHVHLRDGAALASVVKFTAARFGRAIVMPNLKPPVAPRLRWRQSYRERILAALPADSRFAPLMTLYLTDSTAPAEIDRACASGMRCTA